MLLPAAERNLLSVRYEKNPADNFTNMLKQPNPSATLGVADVTTARFLKSPQSQQNSPEQSPGI
jgi:hypothetical protein